MRTARITELRAADDAALREVTAAFRRGAIVRPVAGRRRDAVATVR